MLLADNYEKLQEYEKAELHYKKAAVMCPVKFMPLHRLAKLYDATGDKCRAQALAKIILEKKIKIPSRTINAIRQEMKRLIEKDRDGRKQSKQIANSKENANAFFFAGTVKGLRNK